jgi:hypothetical protein
MDGKNGFLESPGVHSSHVNECLFACAYGLHAFDEAFALCILAASLIVPNNKHMRQNRAATRHRLVNTYGTVRFFVCRCDVPAQDTLTGTPS